MFPGCVGRGILPFEGIFQRPGRCSIRYSCWNDFVTSQAAMSANEECGGGKWDVPSAWWCELHRGVLVFALVKAAFTRARRDDVI